MDRLDRLEIQQECSDVITRYALAVNEGNLDTLVASGWRIARRDTTVVFRAAR